MLSWVFRHRARLGVIYGLSARVAEPRCLPAQPPEGEPQASPLVEEPTGEAEPPLQTAGEVAPGP